MLRPLAQCAQRRHVSSVLSYTTAPLFRSRQYTQQKNISSSSTTSNGKGKLPLAGIRVLDMSRVLAGVSFKLLLKSFHYTTDKNDAAQPYCTQILGDLGYIVPYPQSTILS